MKRLVLIGLVGGFAALLAGCPIYDENPPQAQTGGCGPDGCTDPLECSSASQCDINETCGADNQCHVGDCSFWGCPQGLSCVLGTDSTLSCQSDPTGSGNTTGSGGAGGSGGATGAGGAGGAGGASYAYCGSPSDCGASEACAPDTTCHPGDCSVEGCIFGFACDVTSVSCLPEDPAACGSDSDCASGGAGYACVSGLCTAPDGQCFDQAQCATGSKCAAGKCVLGCAADSDCASGFGCDTVRGTCSTPLVSCALTSDCGGADQVCVDGGCAPRSVAGACDVGLVWVENGCVPDQSAIFACAVDGVQDTCAAGEICLHHGCYLACDVANPVACTGQPVYDVCKTVTSQSGSFDVCGSAQNLGGQCDPAGGSSCASGELCVDGFCK